MRRTFEYRMYPTPGQQERMNAQLASLGRLYNAMLEERQRAWKTRRLSITLRDQQLQLKDVRTLPEYAAIYSHVCQDVALRVDRAYKEFFRRVKSGEKAGYPRFKSTHRYDSLTYKEPAKSAVITKNRVTFSKLAKDVRVFFHRPVRGRIATATVKRKNGKWFVSLSCDDVPADPTLTAGLGSVGLDVGLTNFATLSTGEEIPNPRHGRVAAAKLARAQRDLSSKKKGSRRYREQARKVACIHERIACQRADHAWKLALSLIKRFDTIVVEDLNLLGMVKNRHLARSIRDAAWGGFVRKLVCKAEEAGARVERVPPHGTSINCSKCGENVPKNLAERTHACPFCGLTIGRDHNAAINIKQRWARTEPAPRPTKRWPNEARSPTPQRRQGKKSLNHATATSLPP